MRKQQKQEILDFIKNLDLAHEEIQKAVHANDRNRIQNMFCECQEFAIALGDNIEKLEGEGQITVSYLEEYCEILYQVFQEWTSGSFQENKVQKLLRKQLVKIENSVKNDILVKREAAFFPYKASMWDSLESVYLKAKANPAYDAYCVPIPYYERNPDQSFGQMHYEGGQYPKEIEVVDWKSYNFEERKPDEIYIHNAYDNWNLVTSVHPRFYASNLKQYTEQLIYIPYFILDEVEPDNAAAVESVKHFCFMPGIIYADKVILQSENMKRIYINEYSKAAKENGMPGELFAKEYLEQKFLGLGSPKVEKILHTRKNEVEIPEEWMRVVRKPDGSLKKILFYNTGLTALLTYNEKWVEKIRDVFQICKEKQDEIALLWRPHPLIESTMKSMRPEVLERYLQIKGQYLTEGWGIFDDTADVDRAVVFSDAYYGDQSSVVQLYQKTGKPIMLQDVDAGGKPNVVMYNGVRIGDDWYFISVKDGILYRMDTVTGKVSYVQHILHDKERQVGKLAYLKVTAYRDKLIIVPGLSRYIAVYHLADKTVAYVPFGFDGIAQGQCFNGEVVLGDTLYLIPCQYDRIVAFNMDTEQVEKDHCIELPCLEQKYQDIFSWGGFVQEDESVVFTSLTQKKIFRVHLKTREISSLQYTGEEPLTGIVGIGQGYFVFPARGDKIIQLNRDGEMERVIDSFPCGYECGEWSFHMQQDMGDKVVLLPRLANKPLCIHKDTGEIREIPVSADDFDTENYWDHYTRYMAAIKWNEKTVLVCAKNGVCNILDESYECIEQGEMAVETDAAKVRSILRDASRNGILSETEGPVINIYHFMDDLCNNEKERLERGKR